MQIERIYTEGLAQVAWLISDTEEGVAAIIDPRRDAQIYVDKANEARLKVTAILETHIHADFVSGSLELQKLTGAPIYAAREGELKFEHQRLIDGDEVPIGAARLRAYHTPGHTPEHLSYLLFEGDAIEPSGIFTGDALFVSEVGRPDLLGEDQKEQLLRQLYDTVFERFAPLPDGLTVYPGHGAGSSCGRNIGSAPTTTIGQERAGNYAFQPRSFDEFRAVIMEDMPPPPTYYPVLKRINQQGPPPLEDVKPGPPLSPRQIAEAIEAGETVIDTRAPNSFAERYIPGTMSIGGGASFVDWMGWLAPYGEPVYLILGSDEEYEQRVADLLRIGLDSIAGYLDGGIDAWAERGGELSSYPVITVDTLRQQLLTADGMQVVDVRSPAEWTGGHIEGAYHAYLGDLINDEIELPRSRTLAFVCGSGYRANIGASLARLRGYQDVINVDGGMTEWQNEGYPVVAEK